MVSALIGGPSARWTPLGKVFIPCIQTEVSGRPCK